MAESNQILTEIILDLDKLRQGLKQAENEATRTARKIGETAGGGAEEGLLDGLKKFRGAALGVAAAVGGAFAAMAGAIKAVELAEEANRVDQQFELLTSRAGIMGSSLSEALSKSAAGLVDNTDLLKAANRAIVEMGSSAKRLPEILDFARKATSVFGGDLISNFESINSAIAAGNTRMLRQFGIVIDQKKAFEDYAKSIHVSVNSLNEAGRSQAILNALMEKQKNAFAGVNGDLGRNTEAWQRLKTAISELTEQSSKLFERSFGGIISRTLQSASGIINDLSSSLARLGASPIETAKIKLEDLNRQLENLQKIKNGEQFSLINLIPGATTDAIERTKIQISELTSKIQDLSAKGKTAANTSGNTENPASGMFDVERLKQDQTRFMQVVNQGAQARINAQKALAITESDLEKFSGEEKELIIRDFQTRKDELERQARQSGFIDTKVYNDALVDLEKEKQARIDALRKKELDDQKALSNAFKAGLVTAMVSGFQTIGTALVNGFKDFGDFGKKFLGIIGQFATTIGSFMISTGVAMIALSSLSPLQAIAAGGALVILGSVLSALTSGEGGPAVSTSAGGPSTSFVAGALSSPNEITEQKPQTTVNVHVEGNVLDRKETGLYLADVINEAFGSNGVVFAGAR